jgi:DNA-binding response OmpR family regulator
LKGKETILVAEDEGDLREIVCEALKNSGYTVLQAGDGVEALEHIKSNQQSIDLVLTDTVMPRMGGRELSEEARKLNSNSKFLFLSGYTEDVLIQQGINTGKSHFLEKPFAMKVLLSKVKNILAEETESV